ncbi:hypothetical protein [Deinococcus hohokamensis]|uniref:Macro domain-containing protein n=1 Tax=Deinococcus hohokamensis TaxID=309883 RepID=A0ABV9I7F0_9DEIO
MQVVAVAPDLVVANFIGQHDIARKAQVRAQPPVREDAIREGLERVCEEALRLRASVHVPRIGPRLAGAAWPVIEAMIRQELLQYGLEVTVYNLPAPT